MAEEHESAGNVNVESSDRGLFDFMKKKDDQEEVIVTEFEQKVEISKPEEKHHDHKLHRSHSISSSSSVCPFFNLITRSVSLITVCT